MKQDCAINGVPPVKAAKGKANYGRMDMRIGRDATWFYHGTPIRRKEMVCLFASILTRRADGSYWLDTPAEEGQIEVEDVPFLAVELCTSGSGREAVLSFRTNVDDVVALDTDHPIRVIADENGTPAYLTVRDGLEARLSRAVYYELVAMGVDEAFAEEQRYGVWSCGTFFPLDKAEEPA